MDKSMRCGKNKKKSKMTLKIFDGFAYWKNGLIVYQDRKDWVKGRF